MQVGPLGTMTARELFCNNKGLYGRASAVTGRDVPQAGAMLSVSLPSFSSSDRVGVTEPLRT